MLILQASWVLPVARPPIAQGRVAIEGGRVAWVGARGERGEPRGEVRDLGPGVLLPGLVNAHCHLELSHLRARLPRTGFVPWVRALVESRSADPQVVRGAAAAAIDDLIESGTVAVGDVSNGLQHLDLLADSELRAVVFHELIGWDPAQAGAILDVALGRVAALPARLAERGVGVQPAAHAPHSVSAALFGLLVARGGPAAVHLAESPAESEFLKTGGGEWRAFLRERRLGDVPFAPPGTSPVAYLAALGALRRQLVAAHCVHVDAEDVATLARLGVHVVLCPRSNRNLGVGRAPLPDLLAAGVTLCLGTDSLASVDSLDLLEDAALLHRDFPGVDAATIVRLMTRGGAAALGFSDLGTIEPGKRAALTFAPAPQPLREPLEFLLSGEARPRRVAA